MNEKKCLDCFVILENCHHSKKYCDICSKLRRKKLMRDYSKNRKPENQLKNKNKRNQIRRENREYWKSNNLCSECGEKVYLNLSRCESCHNLNLKSSIKYNRSKGILPAGNSKPESKVFEILSELISYTIIRNTYKIVRSPLTNVGLELDIYVPDLKFAVEVDGPMHRIPCYGEERLKAQIINDAIKDQQCTDKNIFLLIINTDLIINDDYIRTTLSEAIDKAISLLDIDSIERAETREVISLNNNLLHEFPTSDHLVEDDDIVRTI